MDPATLVLIGSPTLYAIFMIAKFFNRGAQHKVLDYDKRWDNAGYVEMTHKAMASEMDVYGEHLTTCECSRHKPKPLPQKAPAIVYPENRFWEVVIDGYKFSLDSNVVPRYAHGEIDHYMHMPDSNFAHGIFKWTDPATGRTKAARVIAAGPVRTKHVYYGDDGSITMDSWTAKEYKNTINAFKAGYISANEARDKLREII